MVLADADALLTADDRELLARGTSTVKYGVSPAQAVKHVLAHLRRRKQAQFVN
jgi:hypothetical protein